MGVTRWKRVVELENVQLVVELKENSWFSMDTCAVDQKCTITLESGRLQPKTAVWAGYGQFGLCISGNLSNTSGRVWQRMLVLENT